MAVGPRGPGGQTRPRFQLPVPPMVVPTLVKVLLALEPRAVMAAMQTTMIRASMTAYSTAVGPLSSFRKLTRAVLNLRMGLLLFRPSQGQSFSATGVAAPLPWGPHRTPGIRHSQALNGKRRFCCAELCTGNFEASRGRGVG